jgi:hypothetical protein
MHLYIVSEKFVINSDIRLFKVRELQERHTKHILVLFVLIYLFNHLFISGLYHDAVGISDCRASNGRMTGD